MSNWCREKNCYCNNTTDFGYCKTTVCIKYRCGAYVPIEFIKAFKKEVRDVANGKAVIDWLLENWEKENERP